MLFKNIQIQFCFFVTVISLILLIFYDNILRAFIMKDIALEGGRKFCGGQPFCLEITKYYSIPAISFLIGSVVIFYMVKIVQRRRVIFISFLLVAVFLLVMGPSHLFTVGVKDYKEYQQAGMSITAFFLAFIIFPVLPEIISLVHKSEGLLDDYILID